MYNIAGQQLIIGCYMLRPFAHPSCFMLLHVVAQSLKPVKIVCYCVRLNIALAELFSTRCNLTKIYN